MAGRHLYRESVRKVAANPYSRAAAFAAVVGTVVGATIPTDSSEAQTSSLSRVATLGGAVLSDQSAAQLPSASDLTVDSVDTSAVALEAEVSIPDYAAEEAQKQKEAEEARQAAAEQARAQAQQAAAAAANVAPFANAGGIVGTALQYVGSPYVWGGSSPAGFDCSGFVAYVYGMNGVSLPHNSDAMRGVGTQIPYSQVQPGDILIWPGHAAISVGGGQNVAALNPALGVRVTNDLGMGTPTVIRVG